MKKALLLMALAFGCSALVFAEGDCKDCKKDAPKECAKSATKECPKKEKECKKDKPACPKINIKELKQKYPEAFAEIEKLKNESREFSKLSQEKKKAADAKFMDILAKEGIELPKKPAKPCPKDKKKEPVASPEAAK